MDRNAYSKVRISVSTKNRIKFVLLQDFFTILLVKKYSNMLLYLKQSQGCLLFSIRTIIFAEYHETYRLLMHLKELFWCCSTKNQLLILLISKERHGFEQLLKIKIVLNKKLRFCEMSFQRGNDCILNIFDPGDMFDRIYFWEQCVQNEGTLPKYFSYILAPFG